MVNILNIVDFLVDKLYAINMIEEKIKLRVSNYIMRILINDCFAFNFVKNDSTANINKFMNKLIPNLLELRKNRRILIHNELSSALEFDSNKQLQERLRQYMDTLFDKIYFNDDELNGFSEVIWIRPKEETETVFDEIIESELEICQTDLSNYLRSLLNEYAKLQQHKRELIIFSKEMEMIQESVLNDNVVNLRYRGQKYSVVMLNYYSEFLYDQSNYVLSYDTKNNKIKSMRLYEMEKMYVLRKKKKLNDDIFCTFHKIAENYSFQTQDTFDIEEVKNETE